VVLDDRSVVALGIRERDGIDATSILVIDHDRLTQGDLAAAARAGATAVAGLPVWLHLDVDVIDPALMPVIYPAGAGLTFEQAETVIGTLLRTCRVIGMDVACFHPNLDRDGSATDALIGLLRRVLAAVPDTPAT
jgi:arginase